MNSDKSPFTYNDMVTGELFIGREKHLAKLQNNIYACEDTTIYGARKIGKSSLVLEAIRLYQKRDKNHLFLRVDISSCISTKDFISLFCTKIYELIKLNKPFEHQVIELANFISSIRPRASIDPITGSLEHTIDFVGNIKNVDKTIDDVFDLLLSLSKNRKLSVIFDEFQNTLLWEDGERLLWKLRSRIQENLNIGFIFLGSSNRLIAKIFQDPKNAFYKATNFIYLENTLDWNLVIPWMNRQFAKAKMVLSSEASMEVLDITRYHPYYLQKLCYQIWANNYSLKSKKIFTIDLLTVRNTIKDLIKQEKINFQERFDKLTNNQKSVVKAIAQKEPEQGLFSNEIRQIYSLPNKSSISSTLKSLEKDLNPLIYTNEENVYVIEDPFFALWLRLSKT